MEKTTIVMEPSMNNVFVLQVMYVTVVQMLETVKKVNKLVLVIDGESVLVLLVLKLRSVTEETMTAMVARMMLHQLHVQLHVAPVHGGVSVGVGFVQHPNHVPSSVEMV